MSIWNTENEYCLLFQRIWVLQEALAYWHLDCIIGGLIGGMIVIIRIINTVMEIIKLISGTFGHNVQKCE